MIGLELLENGAIAVDVDESGQVLARGEAVQSPDLHAAALTALDTLTRQSPRDLAVAALDPESAACKLAIEVLRQKCPRVASPVPSGSAAAVAEAWVGAAPGAVELVFFGAGDHTIAGVLRNGSVVTSARGRGPAVGWLALNPVEREDYRKTGCLEAEVAGGGIVRRMIWRVKSGDWSRVQDIVGGDLSALTVEHVLGAARAGDGVAVSVMRDTAKYLGMAAANLVAITDPTVLVLGGMMASAGDLLLDPVRTEIARRLPAAFVEPLTIVPAALGADAPAIGAVRLASVGP